MKRNLPVILFSLVSALQFGQASAQCIAGTTQSQLNWDNLDFLVTSGAYSGYVTSSMAQRQYFMMGPNRVRFDLPSSSFTLLGENATHTGDAGSNSTGQDVNFNVTTSSSRTVTIVFDDEVLNLDFSLYDIDANQRVTVQAWNALDLSQVILMTIPGGGNVTVVGSGGIAPTGTAAGSSQGNSSTVATVNVIIPTGVDSLTLTFDNASGDFWLSDLNACVTGGFPNNYRAISRPFTGMPSYIITAVQSDFYLLDPATGRAKFIFTDPGHTNVNGMAYDPINRVLYYTYSLTSSSSTNKTIWKYEFDTDAMGTLLVNVTTSLGIPTYDQGVESGSASFYNGYYYFGVESSNSSRTSGRENTVWRIAFDASNNPIHASQVYASRSDSNFSSSPTNRLIHDWSDIGVTNNGILYDFDGARNDSMYYHFNLMTGQRTQFAPNGPGFIGPKQLAIDWQENVFNMGGVAASAPGFIVPYNYDGTVDMANAHTVFIAPSTIPSGSWGDCSEAFRPYCDFGDAPAVYDPDPLSPAVHERDTALRLGATFDREWLKFNSVLADGDGSDEDALPFVPILTPYSYYFVRPTVYNNTGANATVIGWLDYDMDSVFEASEAVSITVPSSTSPQLVTLYWPYVPTTIPFNSYTYLRIRVASSALGMSTANATGYFEDGEAEDYRVLVDQFPLPVQLLSFDAEKTGDRKVNLKWSVADEEANTTYELQRSENGQSWTTIHQQTTPVSNATAEYEYTDARPLKGVSWYRLKFSRQYGSSAYSNTRRIVFDLLAGIRVSPNPASDHIRISITVPESIQALLRVTDASGKLVYFQTLQLAAGVNEPGFGFVRTLPAGIYSVQLKAGEEVLTEKLVVTR